MASSRERAGVINSSQVSTCPAEPSSPDRRSSLQGTGPRRSGASRRCDDAGTRRSRAGFEAVAPTFRRASGRSIRPHPPGVCRWPSFRWRRALSPRFGAASRGLYASVRGGESPCRGVRHGPLRLGGRPAPYDDAVERTTLPIFELGVLLLVAALAGWLARRLRLPAIVGYLALGVLVSPFTPGYVADHEQL